MVITRQAVEEAMAIGDEYEAKYLKLSLEAFAVVQRRVLGFADPASYLLSDPELERLETIADEIAVELGHNLREWSLQGGSETNEPTTVFSTNCQNCQEEVSIIMDKGQNPLDLYGKAVRQPCPRVWH